MMVKRLVKLLILIPLYILVISLGCFGCSFFNCEEKNLDGMEIGIEVTYPKFLNNGLLKKVNGLEGDFFDQARWTLERSILSSKNKSSLYRFVSKTLKYIVGYYDESQIPNVTDIIWYEYSDVSKIKKIDNDLKLGFLFAVVDGEIEYNYTENCTMNVHVKYFYKYQYLYRYDDLSSVDKFEMSDEFLVWTVKPSRFEEIQRYFNTEFYPIVYNNHDFQKEELFGIINKSNKQFIKIKTYQVNKETGRKNYLTREEFGSFYTQLNEILIRDSGIYRDFEGYRDYYGLLEVDGLIKVMHEYLNKNSN